jgi:alpha-mannosidase
MNDKERVFYEKRIVSVLKDLQSRFIEEKAPLEAEYCVHKMPVPFDKRFNGEVKKLKEGDCWGSNALSAWFHVTGSIPAKWEGKMVAAVLNIGGEGCVFDSSGNPVSGISNSSVFDPEFKRERVFIGSPWDGKNDSVDLWIDGIATEILGIGHGNVLGESRHFDARIKKLFVGVFRKDIWLLYMDMKTLFDEMLALPETGVLRAKLLQTLNDASNVLIGGAEDKIQEAREIAKRQLDKPANASALTTTCIGHAHIDTAWLWPLHETVRKCARTFSSQIKLLDEYPEYKFGASQPQHYAFVKENYPELYGKIKEKVAEGSWELQGGMWVEADCNIISGESMVRQILHGKNFFMDEFGVDVKNLWLPDVFGYSFALPQILKKSGIDYFVTQKISWSQFNRFPHHTFVWRGMDGSEVITHFPPEDTYNSRLKADMLIYSSENFQEKGFLDEYLTLFGIGDGGGGPIEEHIESGLRIQNLEGLPKVKFDFAQNMLDRMDERKADLKTWFGELYLEYHRGTYTSQAYNKKMNRRMENRFRKLEFLFSSLPLEKYPSEDMDVLWKRLLLNQFHDIIPGSSIGEVYEDCRKDYSWMQEKTDGLLQEAAASLLKPEENAMTFINVLSFAYQRPVKLPDSWDGCKVLDEAGNELITQKAEDGTYIICEIAPLSSLTVYKSSEKAEAAKEEKLEDLTLENDLIRYEFDSDGTLKRVFDKEMNREVLKAASKGNLLSLYDDCPIIFDAWDIDIYYENKRLENAKLESAEKVSGGPLMQELTLNFSIGSSLIKQKATLAKNSKRLDFKTNVEWNEKRKMLRVSFDMNIFTNQASFDIQFGNVKRNTHRNTSWDMAKFEVVGHKFADISESDCGVALMNDCKYGYKSLESCLDLCLLRAPVSPDPGADEGVHEFTYSLLPHRGNLEDSDVFSESAQLNQIPPGFENFASGDFQLPCSLEDEIVILDTIKKAEKEDALIVRLFETRGIASKTKLKLNGNISSAFETDIMEKSESQMAISGSELELSFGPFEIKTLKLKLK